VNIDTHIHIIIFDEVDATDRKRERERKRGREKERMTQCAHTHARTYALMHSYTHAIDKIFKR